MFWGVCGVLKGDEGDEESRKTVSGEGEGHGS